jgi:hypothetical protein
VICMKLSSLLQEVVVLGTKQVGQDSHLRQSAAEGGSAGASALLPLLPDRERRVPAHNKQGSGDSATWSPSPCYSTVVAVLWEHYLVGILLAMGNQVFIPDGAYQPNRH